MRIGLRGTVRRVWAPRGVKIRQRLQLVYEWRYLVLAVDVVRGRINWTWTETMKGEELLGIVGALPKASDLKVIVWDRAPGHQLVESYEVGLDLVEQPPYAPELNPVERVFEELRRAIEGKVYGSLEEKVQAVEAELAKLDADPARVQSLTKWNWITQALDSLPQPFAA
jgi:DDE superfamily endonuclease